MACTEKINKTIEYNRIRKEWFKKKKKRIEENHIKECGMLQKY